MTTNNGVHAGPNGPRFVFGRENLDYQGSSHLSGQISEEMQDPKNDFASKGKQYGEYGTLTDKQEKERSEILAKEFLEFMLYEGINLQDFFDMDDDLDSEEADDLMADFVNNHQDTVADDFSRLLEVKGNDGFSTAMNEMIRDTSSNTRSLLNDIEMGAPVEGEPGKIKEISYGLENLREWYLEDMSEGNFEGDYDQYLDSYYLDETLFGEREGAKNEIKQLVEDWRQSPTTNGKDAKYVVIENIGKDKAEGEAPVRMPADEFRKDPFNVISKGNDDVAQDWARDNDGNLFVAQEIRGQKYNNEYRVRFE